MTYQITSFSVGYLIRLYREIYNLSQKKFLNGIDLSDTVLKEFEYELFKPIPTQYLKQFSEKHKVDFYRASYDLDYLYDRISFYLFAQRISRFLLLHGVDTKRIIHTLSLEQETLWKKSR